MKNDLQIPVEILYVFLMCFECILSKKTNNFDIDVGRSLLCDWKRYEDLTIVEKPVKTQWNLMVFKVRRCGDRCTIHYTIVEIPVEYTLQKKTPWKLMLFKVQKYDDRCAIHYKIVETCVEHTLQKLTPKLHQKMMKFLWIIESKLMKNWYQSAQKLEDDWMMVERGSWKAFWGLLGGFQRLRAWNWIFN